MSVLNQIPDENIYRAIAEFFKNPEEATKHAKSKFIKWGFYIIPVKYIILKAAQLSKMNLGPNDFVTDDAIYRLRKVKDIKFEIVDVKPSERP